MRDLYRKLNLSPSASQAQIRAALGRVRNTMDDETAKDIETVLLNPDIRSRYDQVYETLQIIGKASSNIEKLPSQNWTPDIAGDFFRRKANRQGVWNESKSDKSSEGRSTQGNKRLVLAAFAMIFCVWVITNIGGGVSYRPDSSYNSPQSENMSATESSENKVQTLSEDNTPTDSRFTDLSPLSTSETCYLQERLSLLGYYKGSIDGLEGPQTASAISAFRANNDVAATGLSRGVFEAARHKGPEVLEQTAAAWRPPNGRTMHSPERNAIAPLEVRVATGGDYFIKLINTSSGRESIAFYVRSGRTWETKVPTGQYEIRYATGRGWYGTRCLFGEDTVAARGNRSLTFKRAGQYIEGHTIELISQPDGNLRRVNMSVEDFN